MSSIFDYYTEGYYLDNDIEVTMEDYTNLLENSLMAAFSDDDETDSIEEGANIDITAAFVSMRKDLRSKHKEALKLTKDKKYSEASKVVGEMIKIIDNAEKEIREIDATDIGSLIFGHIIGFVMFCIECNFPLLIFVDSLVHSGANELMAGLNGATGVIHIASKILKKVGKEEDVPFITANKIPIIRAIVLLYKRINTFFTEAKKEKNIGDHWNGYRNRIIRFIDEYKKSLETTKKSLDRLATRAKAKGEEK